MKIENSQLTDLPKIFELYSQATAYMKSKNQVHWPEFSKELITTEINENRQWKLLINDKIACIWATTLEDKVIWGSADEPSIYIHRIATDRTIRGQNLVEKIVSWANDYGKALDLQYIRMDTVGLNPGLIDHYKKNGFEFLGTKILKTTVGLPEHYKEGEVCYFQKEIS